MEEKIITLETAKLAKEKGFNTPTLFRYQGNHNAGLEYIELFDEIGEEQVSESQFGYAIKGSTHNDGSYLVPRLSAPTQSLLQKWLRDKHNIIVTIRPHFYNMNPPYKIKYEYVIFVHSDGREFDTYEEALEIGLMEALNSIKI